MIIQTCLYKNKRYIFRKNGSNYYLYISYEDFITGNYIYCPNKHYTSEILKENHSIYCKGLTVIKNKQNTGDYEDIEEKRIRLKIDYDSSTS
jgi:predicted small secreted protein